MVKLSQARFSHEDMRPKDYKNMDRLNLNETEYIQRKQNAQKLGWGLVKGAGVGLMATSPYVADAAHQVMNAGQAVYDKWNYEPTQTHAGEQPVHVEVQHFDPDPKQTVVQVSVAPTTPEAK